MARYCDIILWKCLRVLESEPAEGDNFLFKVIAKRSLSPNCVLMEIEAPLVARRALPGQFIIFRVDEYGERIPLTIADYDRERGTVTIMFQPVGASTMMLEGLEPGDAIADFVGPLGKPTEMEGLRRVLVIGGGVGCAIAYPVAKGMQDAGIEVDMVAGFRSQDIVMLEEEMRLHSSALYVMTDDGSYGERGFTTDKVEALLSAGERYDEAVAIGPAAMMKFVCLVTAKYNLKTVVSLNPIMVDGTGMCGCCRVTVGGETRFACVEGPEFDGHQVDWDELIARNNFYREQEEHARQHVCRLTGGVRVGS